MTNQFNELKELIYLNHGRVKAALSGKPVEIDYASADAIPYGDGFVTISEGVDFIRLRGYSQPTFFNRMQAGSLYNKHGHRDGREHLYILAGSIVDAVSGQRYNAGDHVVIEPGVPHAPQAMSTGCQFIMTLEYVAV